MGLYVLARCTGLGLACEIVGGTADDAREQAAKLSRRCGGLVEIYEARRVGAYDVTEVKS